MQFQQSQLTRVTLLALRQDGLFVSQLDARGQVDLATEIPYEEVLPIELNYRSNLPRLSVPGWVQRWTMGIAVWLLFREVLEWTKLEPGAPLLTDSGWGYVLGGLAVLALALLYAWNNWWHQAVLQLPNLRVVLADHPRDRYALQDFVAQARTHAKDYLRREYAPINPLGLIEPQLRRLAWLHELAVLETPEAQALATRLTGRLPGRGFKSMGQRLEGLYVN